MPTILNCPTCQKPVEWSPAARWRPFCSERCRLIDLGAWMSEQHAIPGEQAQDLASDADPREPDDDGPRRH
jgi:hypothetical protein